MRAFLSILLSVVSASHADTFAQWRAIYWQRENTVLSAQAQRDASVADYQHSSSWLNDGASLNVAQLQQNQAQSVYEQQWQLTFPTLFSGSAYRDAKGADAELAQLQLRWQHINTSAQLYRVIAELQIQQQLQQTQQQRFDATQRLHHDITQRLHAGEVAPDDLTQINIELAQAQNDWAQAQLQQQEWQLQLQSMLGETIDVNTIELPELSAANGEHVLLQMAQWQWRKAQAQRDWSQSWSRDIAWSLLYKRERSEIDAAVTNSSGIAITVPLGHTRERRSEQQSTAVAAQLAQQQLQLLQQQLPLQQQRAELRYRSALQRQQQMQQIAQWQIQHLEAVNRAWQHGEMAFADVLRAQQKHWLAQQDRWQAQREQINAQADWFVAFGVLP